jgi:nicotinamide mononucleotide transporter
MNFTRLADLLNLFWQQMTATSMLQWTAVIFGVAEVLMAKANKIWLYPTGIIGTALSIYLLYLAGLFAECGLDGYYIIMSVYGWWHWIKKKNQPPVKPSYCNGRDWIIVSAIVGLGLGTLYFLLRNLTPSTVPFWDAWVSATAWAGMWLLAKRKIENWVLLNISNFFAVPLLFYKQLPLFAALTIFLFIIAVFGYFDWKRIIKSISHEPGTASI